MILSDFIIFVSGRAVENVEHAATSGVWGTLGLNWKLFLAQLVNFTVVLFVLWRWVFKPVVGALETRRQKIEESVKKADEIEKQMRETEILRQQKLTQAMHEAQAVMNKTLTLAEQTRTETLLAAKQEAQKIVASGQQILQAKKQEIMREIKQELADLVVAGTEKILKEKLDTKKDRELIGSVLKDLSSGQ